MPNRILFAALLALVSSSCAAAEAPAVRIDPTKYLTADKLRRGDKGYGLTVFQGTKPEKFDIEVLGVMHDVWDLDSDVILIRCSGHNLEHIGIAAGMSGSPIYVRDKLIGALAYGFSFARAPIAGVTPIAEMLPLLEPPKREPKKHRGGAAQELPDPLELFGRRFGVVRLADRPGREDPRDSGVIELSPIATPVRLSGLGPPEVARRLLKAFGPELEEVGLMPVQGGAAREAEVKDAPLVPGAVVGTQLLWGNLQWGGIGTVTEVVGKRVLAFGHPLNGDADADIPMTNGTVYTILPSFRRTFKLGAGGRIVGRINTDRSKGVAGTIGADGRSVRIRVTVSGLAGDEPKEYRFEALRHPDITPRIAGIAVSSCLFQAGEPPEELTGRYTITVTPEGHGPVVLENVESGRDGWGTLARVYLEVRRIVAELANNPFRRVYPVSIEVRAAFERERRFAVIETVALDRTTVRRGETVRATVVLQGIRGARRRRVVPVPIPPDTPLGNAELQVCGSGACLVADRKDAPGRFDPQTFEQLLALLRREYRRDRLYVRLVSSGQGVALRGRELPDLPASVYGTLAARHQTGLTKVRNVRVTEVPADVVVTGSHKLKLKIEEEP
jgi:hypothetical protein